MKGAMGTIKAQKALKKKSRARWETHWERERREDEGNGRRAGKLVQLPPGKLQGVHCGRQFCALVPPARSGGREVRVGLSIPVWEDTGGQRGCKSKRER